MHGSTRAGGKGSYFALSLPRNLSQSQLSGRAAGHPDVPFFGKKRSRLAGTGVGPMATRRRRNHAVFMAMSAPADPTREAVRETMYRVCFWRITHVSILLFILVGLLLFMFMFLVYTGTVTRGGMEMFV